MCFQQCWKNIGKYWPHKHLNKASTWSEISSIVIFKNVETLIRVTLARRVGDMGKSLTRLNISWTSVLECYSTCYLSRLRDSESKSWSCYSRFTLSFLQMTRRKGSSLVHWPPYSLDSPNSLNVVLLGFKEHLLSPMRCSRSNRLFEMTPSNKLIDVLSSVLCCLLESTEPL